MGIGGGVDGREGKKRGRGRRLAWVGWGDSVSDFDSGEARREICVGLDARDSCDIYAESPGRAKKKGGGGRAKMGGAW